MDFVGRNDLEENQKDSCNLAEFQNKQESQDFV